MKRPSEPALTPYGQLCARLGVEPKQFTVLLAVAGGAIALLGGKALLTPARAKAEPTAAKAAPTPDPAGAAPSAAAPLASETSTEGTGSALQGDASVVMVRLDSAPRRDPFRPFIERPKAEPRDASDAPPDDALTAPDLAMFDLRATMDQEWVVINGQTLRIGDIVGLASDGTPIKLSAVGHRTATLEWRGKRFEIEFHR